jgi:hypothetical protein
MENLLHTVLDDAICDGDAVITVPAGAHRSRSGK